MKRTLTTVVATSFWVIDKIDTGLAKYLVPSTETIWEIKSFLYHRSAYSGSKGT
jgi:hypothetical protein